MRSIGPEKVRVLVICKRYQKQAQKSTQMHLGFSFCGNTHVCNVFLDQGSSINIATLLVCIQY